jgi:hypothetical protein
MKRADPSKKFFQPYVKKLRKFSCAPFGLVQPRVPARSASALYRHTGMRKMRIWPKLLLPLQQVGLEQVQLEQLQQSTLHITC